MLRPRSAARPVSGPWADWPPCHHQLRQSPDVPLTEYMRSERLESLDGRYKNIADAKRGVGAVSDLVVDQGTLAGAKATVNNVVYMLGTLHQALLGQDCEVVGASPLIERVAALHDAMADVFQSLGEYLHHASDVIDETDTSFQGADQDLAQHAGGMLR